MKARIIPLFRKKPLLDGIVALAKTLNQRYRTTTKPIALVGILKGCLPFLMELIKHLDFDIIMDFMIITSYFGQQKPLTKPQLVLDVAINLQDHIVFVIDDIVESGKTMRMVLTHLIKKQPAEIKTISLIYKPGTETIVKPDFYVFTSPANLFLVGFGLDLEEKKRNLPFIGYLKNDHKANDSHF